MNDQNIDLHNQWLLTATYLSPLQNVSLLHMIEPKELLPVGTNDLETSGNFLLRCPIYAYLRLKLFDNLGNNNMLYILPRFLITISEAMNFKIKTAIFMLRDMFRYTIVTFPSISYNM